jgi:hypothetical protein
MGLAMDRFLTPEFWQEVIPRAPWPWVIPSLLTGGVVGWVWKRINDSGEIRGLRAEVKGVQAALNAVTERSEYVREKYEDVVNLENELREKVAHQEKAIAELKKAEVAPPRVAALETSNTEIKNALTNLSTSTSTLGEALTFIPGSAKFTLTTAPPTVETKATERSD